MNFDEWYRQSPTRLTGPTQEDIEIGRKWYENYKAKEKSDSKVSEEQTWTRPAQRQEKDKSDV